MPKCPNCGLSSERTEDWVCKSCGYPLLSKSYKKIPKLYKQLKEERLHKQESPLGAERPHEQKSYLREGAGATRIELAVEELFAVCTLHKEEATARFKDKILVVTGVVSRIVVKYDYDIYYVTLASPEKREQGNVNCIFDKKNGSALSLLTEGQTVTVAGRYDGCELNVLMKDCVLVRSATTPILSSDNTLPPAHTLESIRKPAQEPEPVLEPAPETKSEPGLESAAGPEAEPTPEAELEAGLAQTSIAIEVTVDGLLSAYLADEAAADERFGNKILRITGIVNRIEVKNYLDFDYIDLASAESNLSEHVRCFFDKKHAPELDELTIGQEVTVQGTFDGSIVYMRLRDCVLIP